MSGPGQGSRAARHLEDRAQAPVRWPHPDRATLILMGVWGVAVLLALLVPAAIVGPGEQNAPEAQVWAAFACTCVGAVAMLLAATLLYRHTKDWAVMVWGSVPAFSVVVGGVILAATKLT